ncbi:MAG TPA: polysaccharide deacetylase family protein [Roseiarcus sp.]|nr:polysaccharide deacetylase family protein [Roseiarcus sp.]
MMTKWPSGASAVLCVAVHMDGPACEIGHGHAPLGMRGGGRYAARRGIARCLDIFARQGVKATFFMCGHDAELYPDLMREVHRAGHEIAAHGYQHEDWELGDAEPELLERAHRILSNCVGEAPVGWCSPSGYKSRLTLPTLKRLGYRYDTSEKDDDLPYLPEIEGVEARDFIMLPNNTTSLDDWPMYHQGQGLPSELLANWIAELDALIASGGYVHLIVHPRSDYGSGTPARAAVVERFIVEALRWPGLQVVTLARLAEHCLAAPSQWRGEDK